MRIFLHLARKFWFWIKSKIVEMGSLKTKVVWINDAYVFRENRKQSQICLSANFKVVHQGIRQYCRIMIKGRAEENVRWLDINCRWNCLFKLFIKYAWRSEKFSGYFTRWRRCNSYLQSKNSKTSVGKKPEGKSV